jgi:hypothetical protein
MIDPAFIALGGTVFGGVALKAIGKIAGKSGSKKTKYIEISYYTSSGIRETKMIKASKETFDEFGYRVGYSAHYTRMQEIEQFGYGITACDCEICAEAERQIQREIEKRERILIEIERDKKRAEAIKKRNAEIQAKLDETIANFNDGKYDDIPILHLAKQGIPKQVIAERVNGSVVWPEYAISGTAEVTYEKTEEKKVMAEVEFDEIHVQLLNQTISVPKYKII